MHDLRSALRTLVATPVVSLVAVVSLALGIGATIALFPVYDSLLLRELPVTERDRLVLLAGLGLYGVTAHAVGRQRAEIGGRRSSARKGEKVTKMIERAMNTHAPRPTRRRTGGWSLLLVVVMGMATAGQSRDQESIRALHRTMLTVDSHVDTPMRMPTYDIGKRHPLGIGMVDLPRMEDGGLAAAVFAAFLEQGELNDEARQRAIQFGRAKVAEIARQVNANPANARLVKSADDIEAAFREGKKAVIVGMENGYQIGLDLDNLDRFFDQGVRILTLTHKSDNDICDSSTDDKHPEDRGLSDFGRRVIERMNRLGMTIDVSHASDRTFFDVVRLSRSPIIASHSSARGVQEHPRNLSDEQLRALQKNGGVVGITFVLPFLKREVTVADVSREIQALNDRVMAKGGWPALKPDEAAAFQKDLREIKYRYPQAWASVKDVVDHIDHVVRTIGIDHVGIGSDFDGGGYLADCRDVSEYLNLTTEMVRRGYSEADIRKIWGGNYLRVLRRVQELATPRAPTPSGPGT